MTHKPSFLMTALLAPLLLGACSIANGYTEQEQEVVDSMTPSQYLPAGREIRDNIETQDLFAQAAFWSREYQLNPSDLEAAIKLAAAVRKMGNPSKAVEITQTTRALYPRDPYLTAEYAAALIASDNGADAIKTLDEGLNAAPGYARLWSLKGAALDQMENYDLARKHYERALRITPQDPNIMSNMGLSYALSGNPAMAETWLEKAAAAPGAEGNIHQNLALIRQINGKSTTTSSSTSSTTRVGATPESKTYGAYNPPSQSRLTQGATPQTTPSMMSKPAPRNFSVNVSKPGEDAPSASDMARQSRTVHHGSTTAPSMRGSAPGKPYAGQNRATPYGQHAYQQPMNGAQVPPQRTRGGFMGRLQNMFSRKPQAHSMGYGQAGGYGQQAGAYGQAPYGAQRAPQQPQGYYTPQNGSPTPPTTYPQNYGTQPQGQPMPPQGYGAQPSYPQQQPRRRGAARTR